jgi:hypothetical protein
MYRVVAAWGVIGSNLQLVNSGTIVGGLSGSGAQANAITFTGGINSLEIDAGSSITGNVVARVTDTFILGGTTNAIFNTSLVGPTAQY